MRPAASARDRIAGHHAVVPTIAIRQQNLLVISQEIFWPVASPVQGEIENVIRMGFVPDIHPHARRFRLAHALHRHNRVIRGYYVRLPYALRHQLIQGLHQIGYVATPDRLCRPRDLKSLAFEDIFQSV